MTEIQYFCIKLKQPQIWGCFSLILGIHIGMHKGVFQIFA